MAIVSPTPGTTTDPVRKRMELLGVGPVLWIDTAGIDDEGELGQQRVARTQAVLDQADLALVLCGSLLPDAEEQALMAACAARQLPYLQVYPKSDLRTSSSELLSQPALPQPVYACSALSGAGIPELLQAIKACLLTQQSAPASLLQGLIAAGQTVLLICPIDSEAPAGRLILPQVQTLRSALDLGAVAVCLTPDALPGYWAKQGSAPDLVITDSQLFGTVEKMLPPTQALTSFSMLQARQKGFLDASLQGTPHISQLQDGDRVLILESCTHHSSCEDIGRVKLPQRMLAFTGKKLHFDWITGLDPLPEDLSSYALVMQCGACMVSHKQIRSRVQQILSAGVPLSNYGMALAYMANVRL